jgi:hypothetical protein
MRVRESGETTMMARNAIKLKIGAAIKWIEAHPVLTPAVVTLLVAVIGALVATGVFDGHSAPTRAHVRHRVRVRVLNPGAQIALVDAQQVERHRVPEPAGLVRSFVAGLRGYRSSALVRVFSAKPPASSGRDESAVSDELVIYDKRPGALQPTYRFLPANNGIRVGETETCLFGVPLRDESNGRFERKRHCRTKSMTPQSPTASIFAGRWI